MKTPNIVADIMTRKVITVNNFDELETAELLFKTHNIRHIPVLKYGEVIGMLSYTDLLRISFADAVDDTQGTIDTVVYNMFTIEQVMTKQVVSVTPTTSIKDVAKFLASKEFHALPVVENNELVGIVTTTDLLHVLVDKL